MHIGLTPVATDSSVCGLRSAASQPGADWQDMAYPVRLDWTLCHYGGKRAWWLCPAADCGRRVALLFSGQVFTCRHCHRLAYRSQRETDDSRVSRLADKLREVLGWKAGILNGDGGKPKGMHWRTFERLQGEHDAHVIAALAGMTAKLGVLREQLDGIDLGPV